MIHRRFPLLVWPLVTLLLISSTNLSAAGRVVTVAGNGQSGYSGDGGPADRASVGGPFGVSLGPDGALYVCEIDNHCVRRIARRRGRVSPAGEPHHENGTIHRWKR